MRHAQIAAVSDAACNVSRALSLVWAMPAEGAHPAYLAMLREGLAVDMARCNELMQQLVTLARDERG